MSFSEYAIGKIIQFWKNGILCKLKVCNLLRDVTEQLKKAYMHGFQGKNKQKLMKKYKQQAMYSVYDIL